MKKYDLFLKLLKFLQLCLSHKLMSYFHFLMLKEAY